MFLSLLKNSKHMLETRREILAVYKANYKNYTIIGQKRCKLYDLLKSEQPRVT